MKSLTTLCLASLFAATAVSTASAQTLFLDTFSDGNDTGWSRFNYLGDYGQLWSVAGGEYRLRSTLPVPNDGGAGMVSIWTDSITSAEPYTHGFIRSKVRIMSGGTSACLFLRSNWDFEAYTFVLSDTANAGIMYAQTLTHGVVELGRFPVEGGVVPGTYYMMEGGAVGPNISLKIWPVSSSEPAEPQLQVVDYTISREGLLGTNLYLSILWPNAATIEARFDDIQFTSVPYCQADFNNDGFLDFFDYDDFVVAFELGDPNTDFNGDGFLDFFDYDDFVVAFEAGC